MVKVKEIKKTPKPWIMEYILDGVKEGELRQLYRGSSELELWATIHKYLDEFPQFNVTEVKKTPRGIEYWMYVILPAGKSEKLKRVI